MRLVEKLNQTLLNLWDSLLSDLPAQDAQQVADYLNPLKARLLDSISAVDDETMNDTMLAMFFAEFKAHWLNLNNQVQYFNIVKGESDLITIYITAGLSLLLQKLEEFLPSERTEALNQCLSENHTGLLDSDYAVIDIDQIVLKGQHTIYIHRKPE